jgi:hypothetical protein
MKFRVKNLVRLLALSASLLAAQTAKVQGPAPGGNLRGQVTDPSAASIPGAMVILQGTEKVPLRQTTDVSGMFTFKSVPPGTYTLRVLRKGFAPFELMNLKISGPTTFNVPMTVAAEAQEVTVTEESGKVSVDPNSNVGALVLKGADLDALSDDPDQLSDDLQALAGPSAGPSGGQIFIDGFSGGQLPPKSSIREIRVNQNPFSAEYDRLGFGRIEVFTKPGTDRFRGQLMTGFSDNEFNARNPFVDQRPPYQSRLFMGNVSGPLTKKISFSFDVQDRSIRENAVINATILDSTLTPQHLSQAMVTPEQRLSLVPRLDFQLTDKITLTARYAYTHINNQDQGIGNYSLTTRAYDAISNENTLQLTETAMINVHTVNETRFQFMRGTSQQNGDNSVPTIQVLDAFTGGGAQIGRSYDNQNRYELNNMTSIAKGVHAWKFGGRLRVATLADNSPQNFGGTYLFGGGEAPLLDANNQPVLGTGGGYTTTQISSIERYRRTLFFLNQGMTAAQIRALGGGATQFSIAGGTPLSSLNQTDLGVFFLDDWRARPNLTLSYGLRYENQTNISDHKDFSPRLSFAWGMDGGAKKQAKTVLRGGMGIFYDRIASGLSLNAMRFNGITQQQYIVQNPDFYPVIPALSDLATNRVSATTWHEDSTLSAPYIMQGAIGIDRQLPHNTAVSVMYNYSRGVRLLRSVNINTPLASGVLPYVNAGNLYMYESTGLMRQKQLITNINTRFTKNVSLWGFYMLNYANGDTDGGSSSFPASAYNFHSEWGPTSFDVRQRLFLGGSVNAPFGIMLAPFITASSGLPFNIVVGRDINGDTVLNDRPAFATNASAAGVVTTPWGIFNINPGSGDQIIPRNYGRGPAQFNVNMRLMRTWGFGKKGESGPGDFGPGGGGRGGRGPGGMMGGPGMMGGRGGMGRGGPFGATSTGKRFNLTFSISARNLFNRVNLATPVGNLSSTFFGESTSLASGFGSMGSSVASNRRIDMQLRFTF